MAKLALNPSPTFSAKVLIPVAGAEPAPVVMTFRHRTRKALAELTARVKASEALDEGHPDKIPESAFILDCVTAWDLDDPLTAENVDRLLDGHHGAGAAISVTYYLTLSQGRQGN